MRVLVMPKAALVTRMVRIPRRPAAPQHASRAALWSSARRHAGSRRSTSATHLQLVNHAAGRLLQCRATALRIGISSRWQCIAADPRQQRRSSVATTATVAVSAAAASQAAQTSAATLLISVGIFVLTCAVAAFLICAIPTLLVLPTP